MFTITFLRQFRIGEYAIFDFTVAFLGLALLSPLLSWLFSKIFRLEIPKKNWVFLTLPIGIATHLIIGPITPMTRNFFDPHGHYALKVVILGLVVLGLRNIKRVKNPVLWLIITREFPWKETRWEHFILAKEKPDSMIVVKQSKKAEFRRPMWFLASPRRYQDFGKKS